MGGRRIGWAVVRPTDWDDSRREIFPFGRSRPTGDEAEEEKNLAANGGNIVYVIRLSRYLGGVLR